MHLHKIVTVFKRNRPKIFAFFTFEENRFYFVAKRRVNINYLFLLFLQLYQQAVAKGPMVFKSRNSPKSNFMHGKIGHSLGSEYHVEKK